MADAYIVLTGDEKQDLVSPTQIGPFADAAAANEYVDRHDGIGEKDSSYAEAVIVCAENAMTPAEYDNEWQVGISKLARVGIGGVPAHSFK
jgi:hypothetical protein